MVRDPGPPQRIWSGAPAVQTSRVHHLEARPRARHGPAARTQAGHSSIAELTVCDLWFDYLSGMGVPGFEVTHAVFVRTRKKDSIRKGHFPALGHSRDPRLNVVRQLTGLAALDWLVRSARIPEATATPSEMSRLLASILQDVQDSGRAHRPGVGPISTPEDQRGYQADGRHRRL